MRPSVCFVLGMIGAGTMAAGNDVEARVNRAVAVLDSMTSGKGGLKAEQLASADCIAVIPGFKKGAAVVGVGFGRGFISCRKDAGWSAPGAIKLESESLGVQVGGEDIDIVVLSLDRSRRVELLSERFAVGADASAAWGNGKTAYEDHNAKILFFGRTKGIFSGFGLDGVTLSRDESGNKALYGKSQANGEIVESGDTPTAAQPLIAKLSAVAGH
jgi:lipid-binding SYLF domain-containing protein